MASYVDLLAIEVAWNESSIRVILIVAESPEDAQRTSWTEYAVAFHLEDDGRPSSNESQSVAVDLLLVDRGSWVGSARVTADQEAVDLPVDADVEGDVVEWTFSRERLRAASAGRLGNMTSWLASGWNGTARAYAEPFGEALLETTARARLPLGDRAPDAGGGSTVLLGAMVETGDPDPGARDTGGPTSAPPMGSGPTTTGPHTQEAPASGLLFAVMAVFGTTLGAARWRLDVRD